MSEELSEEQRDLSFFDAVVDSISLQRSVATALLMSAEDLEKKLTQLVQSKFPEAGIEETFLTVVPNSDEETT
ncbi:MAG: hypothetical protein CBD49_00960 [Acidimicrobiaceae bacterium TMED189]|nr:MAG: hypothetical protein CBD49_00960 [Acidimicrobiaceae bacterium TMED189]|tara:strand:+ start:377 stop:595 length:219 start_codon:yes stop_codon:yes gene_type:complete